MFILEESLKEIKNLAKIHDVVSSYISLSKKGNDYFGICPFHEDKTPSFSVSPKSNLYYCFGCGIGGDAINFIQRYKKSTFVDAVLELAESTGIKIKLLDVEKQEKYNESKQKKDIIYEILSITRDFYFNNLKNNYIKVKSFLNSKNINDESVVLFKLGYAGEHRDELYQYLINRIGEHKKHFVSAGVVKKSETGYFDFFRNRVVIPIQDAQGKIVGFGGRTLLSNEDTAPKYLNTSDSIVFSKGDILFGLNFAKDKIRNFNYVILTEGYFDVIAAHQMGFSNTVACLGTALTPVQTKLMLKHTNNIILNLDNDLAGVEATKKIIDKLEVETKKSLVDLRVIEIPDKDISDLLANNDDNSSDVYKKHISNSKNWIDWLVNETLKNENLSDTSTLKKVFNDLLVIVKKLDDIERVKYIQYFSEILSLGNVESQSKIYEIIVENTSDKYNSDNHDKIIDFDLKRNDKVDIVDLTKNAEESIIKMYINFINYRKFIRMQINVRNIIFCNKLNKAIWIKIIEIEGEPIDNKYDNFVFSDNLIDKILMMENEHESFDINDYMRLSDDEILNMQNFSVEILLASFNAIEKRFLEEKMKIYIDMFKDDIDGGIFDLYESCFQQLKKINKDLGLDY